VQSEPGSIEQLYRQHSGELYSYLARRCPDTATAGDLLQETFLQVVRQTDQLPAVTMPRAWLFGIARHLLARHYRRQRDPLPVAQTWYEAAPEPAAEDDRLAAMQEAIRTLPAELRDTLETEVRTGIVLRRNRPRAGYPHRDRPLAPAQRRAPVARTMTKPEKQIHETRYLERLLMDRALGRLDPAPRCCLADYLAKDPAAATQARELQETVRLATEVMRRPAPAVEMPSQIHRLVWRRRAEQVARARRFIRNRHGPHRAGDPHDTASRKCRGCKPANDCEDSTISR